MTVAFDLSRPLLSIRFLLTFFFILLLFVLNNIVHSPLKLHFSICTCYILFWSLARFYVHLWNWKQDQVVLSQHRPDKLSNQLLVLKPVTRWFWMLHEKNILKFSLRHLLPWWALVNSYTGLSNWSKVLIFWLRNRSCSHS